MSPALHVVFPMTKDSPNILHFDRERADLMMKELSGILSSTTALPLTKIDGGREFSVRTSYGRPSTMNGELELTKLWADKLSGFKPTGNIRLVLTPWLQGINGIAHVMNTRQWNSQN